MVSPVRSFLSGQFLKCEHWGCNHMTQGIDEQIGTIPAIKAEFHLLQIGGEMLCGNLMPRSHDAALEQRERGFDGIGVNVAHNVHAGTVVDFLVVRSLGFPHGSIVRGCVIGEDDFHILRDIFADVLSECSALRVSRVEEAEIAVAFADADDHFFVVHLPDLAFAAIPAADVRCIHFDFAVEHRLVGLCHCVPDAMAEIPCCFVASDSKRALNLAGRNTFLCFAEEQGRHEPTHERQMRIIEYGARCDGELVVTVFAVEEVLFGFEQGDWPFATQAARTLGEAQTGEQFAALGIRREHGIEVN